MRELSNRHGYSLGWRPIPLFVAHLAAGILLLSYVHPFGHIAWRAVDERVFFMLNSTLTGPGLWELFWAWASTRYGDALTGLLIVMLLLFPLSGFPREHLRRAAFLCLSMMLLLLTARTAFHVLSNWMQLGGPGPSLVLAPVVRLSEIFPGIPLKDASRDSFPGDHATVLFAWAGFVLLGGRSWKSWLAAGLPAMMVFPRLIAGAHWLSDLMVGSLIVALPVLGWTYCSPLIGRLANLAEWAAGPIIARVATWPWFRQQDFFAYGPEQLSTTIRNSG